MNSHDTPARTVQATETTFALLETINDSKGMTLTELADNLDMAKSTVHRYLQTLLSREYLVKEGNTYHVSLRFLDLGENARNRKRGYQLSKAKVNELAAETQERAQFIVEEHGRAVYVHRKAGSHAVHTDPGIGKRTHLHAISAGKAIIAEWDDKTIEEFVDYHGLPAITEYTITDRDELWDTVHTIRDRGYSINREESIEGLGAIGVSICDSGEVIGALSVSGPSNRFRGDRLEQELPDLLMGMANEIELNIQYP